MSRYYEEMDEQYEERPTLWARVRNWVGLSREEEADDEPLPARATDVRYRRVQAYHISIRKEILSFEDAPALMEQTLRTEGVELQGMMGVAPDTDDERTVRAAFQRLRRLYDALPAPNRRWLSMGMTHDFEIAIEEGSTMLRLGTALFGARA